ncbi:MAG: hypothetical protein JWP12_521 [Bacteroidetes bacterium]|nr:hypothetical protein [Bacteroidota bacterium]
MKLDEYGEKIELLKKLVANATTGRPKELAEKLGVSERTVRRLIDRLKSRNSKIEFDRKINSYVFKN